MSDEFISILEEYRSKKNSLKAIHTRILKTIPRKSIFECAKKLNMFKPGTLAFPNINCANLFEDFLLYSWPSKELSPVVRYKDPENDDLLYEMRSNRMSIFLLTNLGNGKVQCKDFFNSRVNKEIIDLNLSETLTTPDTRMVARLLDLSDMYMLTGVGFPIAKKEVLRALLQAVSTHLKKCRVAEVDDLMDIQETNFEALLIKTCIKYGAYKNFSSADV